MSLRTIKYLYLVSREVLIRMKDQKYKVRYLWLLTKATRGLIYNLVISLTLQSQTVKPPCRMGLPRQLSGLILLLLTEHRNILYKILVVTGCAAAATAAPSLAPIVRALFVQYTCVRASLIFNLKNTACNKPHSNDFIKSGAESQPVTAVQLGCTRGALCCFSCSLTALSSQQSDLVLVISAVVSWVLMRGNSAAPVREQL